MNTRQLADEIARRYFAEWEANATGEIGGMTRVFVLSMAAKEADRVREIAEDVLSEQGVGPVPPKPDRRPTEEEDRATRTPQQPAVMPKAGEPQ